VAQGVDQILVYLSRLVRALGGHVIDRDKFETFAYGSYQQERSFDETVELLEGHPDFAKWIKSPTCVANRQTEPTFVKLQMKKACSKTYFSCDDGFPSDCTSIYDRADYVFSAYYMLGGEDWKDNDTLTSCYWEGAAIPAEAGSQPSQDKHCIISGDPWTVPLTDEGFVATEMLNDTEAMQVFMERVITEQLHSIVRNPKGKDMPLDFANHHPKDMYNIRKTLIQAEWLCGGQTFRPCPALEMPWKQYGFSFLAFTSCGTCFATLFLVRCKTCFRRSKADDTDSEGSEEVLF
jgi:hypothetical protein